MVIVKLSGGLGNQMFQYAFGRFIAYKLNTELKLDLSETKISLNPKHHSFYRLGDFNIQENFATPEEIAHVKATGIFAPPAPVEDETRDVFIQGHSFHAEESFIEIADIILREFTLKSPLHKISTAWAKKILVAENSVALHIRRGDYLNAVHIIGVIPLDYYRTCVAQLQKDFPLIAAFIFSDDLNWVRKNLKLDVPTEYVEDCESDNEEFLLMSLCKHTVIANSTFSWWAAWLNFNPDKKVFVPSPWSRSGLWDNGIPKTWTKVPVDYENVSSDYPPLLSIIVYVRNNASTLPIIFSGILSQTFRDYELILIDDASTDGGENICRQVSLNKKVTFLGAREFIGKAKAWNKGLDYARGEYVLFLNGYELIMPNATRLLCQFYSLNRTDLIFSVHYLEENAEGNLSFGDISDKRFSRHVDEQFKNLSAWTTFQSDDLYQKLMMTGTQAFNPLLSTKFFQRDFLIKNSVRFNENLQSGFELLFLVNAVMSNEEFLFTPDIFIALLKI